MVASGSRNAVTVAAVCDSVGCTAPALYRHFADKQALVEAVCQRLFDSYAEAFERVVISTDRAADRLHAFSECYVDFAFANPGAYRVLFMHGPDEQVRSSDDGGPTVAMFRYLSSIVAAFCAERMGAVSASTRDQVHELACLCWSAVHGPVSLVISKPGFAWPGDGERFARSAVRVAVNGLVEAEPPERPNRSRTRIRRSNV